MKEQNEIGDIFRNALDGLEIQPSNKVWNGIKEKNNIQTPKKPGFSKLSNLLKIAGSIALVTVIVFVAVKLFETIETDIPVKDQTTVQNINENHNINDIPRNSTQENNTSNEIIDNNNEVEKSGDLTEEAPNNIENNNISKNNSEPTANKTEKQDNTIPDNDNSTQLEKQNSTSNPNLKSKSADVSPNIGTEPNNKADKKVTKELPKPTYISNEKYICFGEDDELTASYGTKYIWSNGSTIKTIKVEPVNTTVYTVTCTNNKGNIWIENITVNIDRGCSSVFTPNAFTPNGDGNNDVYLVYGTGIKEFSITIFSRRGELVFETNDINHGWDGTYRGQNASAEVYYYKVNYIDGLGKPHRKVGNITLIK